MLTVFRGLVHVLPSCHGDSFARSHDLCFLTIFLYLNAFSLLWHCETSLSKSWVSRSDSNCCRGVRSPAQISFWGHWRHINLRTNWRLISWGLYKMPSLVHISIWCISFHMICKLRLSFAKDWQTISGLSCIVFR